MAAGAVGGTTLGAEVYKGLFNVQHPPALQAPLSSETSQRPHEVEPWLTGLQVGPLLKLEQAQHPSQQLISGYSGTLCRNVWFYDFPCSLRSLCTPDCLHKQEQGVGTSICRSVSVLISHTVSQQAEQAATYSASVLDKATMLCFLLLQITVFP